MKTTILPMQLGDIFEQTFEVIRRTIAGSALVLLVVVVPAVILFSLSLDVVLSSFADRLAEMQAGNTPDASLLADFLFAGIAVIIFMLTLMVARMSVTAMTCGEIEGTAVSWWKAIQRATGKRLACLIGQAILEGLCITAFAFTPFLLVSIASMAHSMLGVLAALVLFPLLIVFMINYLVRWSMTTAPITWEDAGPLDAFVRSNALVSGGWWRVFGILVLFGLMVQFAVTMIQTPVGFLTMWDFYSSYFNALGSGGATEMDPSTALQLFRSMGYGMGISIGLGSMLTVLVQPVYLTVLYYDLRARHGEFLPPNSKETQDDEAWEIQPQ